MPLEDQVRAALHGAQGESDTVKASAVSAAVSNFVPPPAGAQAALLWKVFIVGLVGLMTISLIGLIVLLAEGKSSTVMVTIFTSLLSALVGVFVKSPVS
jgi:hypothetical protein